MKVWIAKNSNGKIKAFLFKPHKLCGLFSGYDYICGRFAPILDDIPYNIIEEELGIDVEKLEEEPIQVELTLKRVW